jgi:OFA family oxalate/formate antiporter-like MFS transporter
MDEDKTFDGWSIRVAGALLGVCLLVYTWVARRHGPVAWGISVLLLLGTSAVFAWRKRLGRWLIVVGAVAIQLSLGAIQSGAFFALLMNALHLSLSQATTSLFSVPLASSALAAVVGGWLQDRLGPRAVVITGGVLSAAGMIIATFARDVGAFTLFYGAIRGVGIAFASVCSVVTTLKWFPDRRGLATGLVLSGLGAGAIHGTPLGYSLSQGTAFGLTGPGLIGIFATIRWFGAVSLVLAVVGGLILRDPPPGYKPVERSPSLPTVAVPGVIDYTVNQMLGTWQFWVIWLMCFAGKVSFVVTSQSLNNAPGSASLGRAVLEQVLTASAVAGALGLVFWGRLSDSVNRSRVLFLMYIIGAVAASGYFVIASAPVTFWGAAELILAACSGVTVIYAAISADYYGVRHAGVNYGLISTATAAGALLANELGFRIKELTGKFDLAIVLASVLCLAAAAAGLALRAPTRVRQATQTGSQ